MSNTVSARSGSAIPSAAAVLELLKPVTWFPPMWAFGCGVISSGIPISSNLFLLIAGIALSGPLVCGTSQAVNDWYDRFVDAINEPNRPIPSGRVSGSWGLGIAILWSILSLVVAAFIGPWVFGAAVFGLASAWAYSAPPLRLKANGWWGNGIVGLCYEGLPWFTGAAALVGGLPSWPVIILATLYSAGAHGIMTLNDFKAIEGDTRMGVRSLPVQLGVRGAAVTACVVMAIPQAIVVALLMLWDRPVHAAVVAVLLVIQLLLMKRFLADPKAKAVWYSGLGVTLYVLGMLTSAFAVRGMVAGA